MTDDCLEGDVRIRGGTHPSNGRVEVCKNGIWGSVCFSGWSDNEAAVVCRHLGHDSNGTANLSYTRILVIVTFSPQDSKSTNVFGAGPPVLSDFFKCDGNEASFEFCQRSINNDFNSESCSSAGVILLKGIRYVGSVANTCLISCIYAMYIFFNADNAIKCTTDKSIYTSEIIER